MKFSRLLIPAVFALLLSAPGCLFHTRTVEVRLSNAKLQAATQQELIDRLNQEAARIQTLNATVDIDTEVGGEKRGTVTSFKEIRGYVLVRKPNMLRMIGLYPIVRNKAFDMVSDGHEFKLSIPANNKFYVGHNQAIQDSSNPLDTLRPQAIYDALLLREVDPNNEIAVLESSTEMLYDPQTKKMVQQPNYVLDVIRKTDKGWILARKVVFDRTNLSPHRQITYDELGNRVTEASYQKFKDYDGIPFPGVIEIKRPQEEYDIRLSMVKLTLNQPITEDQFALQQPVGSELVNLDERNKNAAATPDTPAVTPAAGSSPAAASSASPH
jgi:outer membrane lipoprotein-sorting protein